MQKTSKFIHLTLACGVLLGNHVLVHAQEWQTVVNNNDIIPDRDPADPREFNSYNPPSINSKRLVVFRARAQGGAGGVPGQVSGIYTRDMRGGSNHIVKEADRDTTVPPPNNNELPVPGEPGERKLVDFNEFPSFPRIAHNRPYIATRGNHPPVWRVDDDESGGTTGVYFNLQANTGRPPVTGASNTLVHGILELGQVPGAPTGTKFDVFPGSPAITDSQIIVTKGNFAVDDIAKTGVFYRQVTDEEFGGSALIRRVASSDTVIPNPKPDGCLSTTFGSTAPPSAHKKSVVFVGKDFEDAPECGGIYWATLKGDDPVLEPVITLGVTPVPGKGGAIFTNVGEALSISGKFLAFWGSWGTETKTVKAFCPTTGNRDRRMYCRQNDTNTIYDSSCDLYYQEFEQPVHQGIFVYERSGRGKGKLYLIASTDDDDFDDFLFSNYSGAPPGAGEGEDDDREPPRIRFSAFVSITFPTAKVGAIVAYKARTGLLDYDAGTCEFTSVTDGIYWTQRINPGRDFWSLPSTAVVETGWDANQIDPEAIVPPGFNESGETLFVEEVAIERLGTAKNWIAITIGSGRVVTDAEGEESDVEFAGIYMGKLV